MQHYQCLNINNLEQFGRFASLHHTIYTMLNPTHVDVDHATHALGPTM